MIGNIVLSQLCILMIVSGSSCLPLEHADNQSYIPSSASVEKSNTEISIVFDSTVYGSNNGINIILSIPTYSTSEDIQFISWHAQPASGNADLAEQGQLMEQGKPITAPFLIQQNRIDFVYQPPATYKGKIRLIFKIRIKEEQKHAFELDAVSYGPTVHCKTSESALLPNQYKPIMLEIRTLSFYNASLDTMLNSRESIYNSSSSEAESKDFDKKCFLLNNLRIDKDNQDCTEYFHLTVEDKQAEGSSFTNTGKLTIDLSLIDPQKPLCSGSYRLSGTVMFNTAMLEKIGKSRLKDVTRNNFQVLFQVG
ncbi:MAG: hypothetical protein K2X94_01635 [Amoebophilaceae bacterium]|nr:hypothetical protein [Amoebophilaceae bacterium]